MKPKFCPNCAAQFLHTMEIETTDPEPESGWDCFCRTCYWSGDIYPDYQEVHPRPWKPGQRGWTEAEIEALILPWDWHE